MGFVCACVFLIMGNAGFISSTVSPDSPYVDKHSIRYTANLVLILFFFARPFAYKLWNP